MRGTLARVPPLPEGAVGGHARKRATHADVPHAAQGATKTVHIETKVGGVWFARFCTLFMKHLTKLVAGAAI